MEGTVVEPPVAEAEVFERFLEFLKTYGPQTVEVVNEQGRPEEEETTVYKEQVVGMVEKDATTLFVDLAHLREANLVLHDVVEEYFVHVEATLRRAVQAFVREVNPSYAIDATTHKEKQFFVGLDNVPNVDKLRTLKANNIGRLRAFSGTVTRTSEVRPELYAATFRCLLCQTVVRDVIQQFKFTMPCICPSPTCGNKPDGAKPTGTGEWELIKEESTFVDWQRAKVQENADEIPAGSLPRTMDVIMRGSLVETARPGDKLVFTGMLVVVPDIGAIQGPGEKKTMIQNSAKGNDFASGEGIRGLKALGVRELHYKLNFLAYNAVAASAKKGAINIRTDDAETVEDVIAEYSPEQQRELRDMIEDPDVYSKLARSIAPQVYGHEDIKKALLLMLLGGVHKQTPEGINLRGDINVAIVGDPACGKSQMLKWVSGFMPRAVYTAGKSSSAAGLTATVVKEPESGEFCIEAGALMLADNGICCIDEFDKMDPRDQVAIHEAMEQQTISITKAGIQATLHARASILAAANPLGGRYDRSRALRWNVALPPAILSRFDLLHIMVDEPDELTDAGIAGHIVNVHLGRVEELRPPYTPPQMQRYLKYARAHRPALGPESKAALVAEYKALRLEDAAPGSGSSYRITVRQLEALVRLCEALARCQCARAITVAHVREARRLLKNSIVAIEQPDVEVDDEDADLAAGAAERIRRDNAALLAATDERMAEADEVAPSGDTEPPSTGPTPQENAADENADANRAGPSTTDAPAAAGAGAAARAAERKKTAISAKEYTRLKNLVILRLRRAEEAGAARAPVGEDEGMPDAGGAGLPQKDLMAWYVEHELVERGMAYNHDELDDQLILLTKVINHLVRKEGVVVVVDEPARKEGETTAAYRERLVESRVLALNPNFALE